MLGEKHPQPLCWVQGSLWQKHLLTRLGKHPASLLVGEGPAGQAWGLVWCPGNSGSDLKWGGVPVAPLYPTHPSGKLLPPGGQSGWRRRCWRPSARGLGPCGQLLSGFSVPMQPALPSRLPARGAGSDCAHTAWVGGLRLPPQERLGTASCLAAAGPHLASPPESPPRVLPRAGRPAPPRSLWGSGWLWFALPLWEGGGSGGSWPPHPRLEAQSRCAAGPTGPRPAAPWAGVLGWGPEQAGGEGAACCPPCRSPMATATEVAGGAGQAERAGGQGRDEKALHGRTKAVCELGRLASGPSGQTER